MVTQLVLNLHGQNAANLVVRKEIGRPYRQVNLISILIANLFLFLNLIVGSACQYLEQTRNCYTGLCPYDHDDYVVYIHLKIGIEPKKWNWVYTEDLFTAFVILFKVS